LVGGRMGVGVSRQVYHCIGGGVSLYQGRCITVSGAVYHCIKAGVSVYHVYCINGLCFLELIFAS